MTARLAFIESNTGGTGRLFLRASVQLGLTPVLLTADRSRYKGFAEEGAEIRECDTSDDRALLAACRRLMSEGELRGVTSSSEYYILKAARLARRLELSGPDPTAVESCRDKEKQRSQLHAAGVGAPTFRAVSSVEEANSAALGIGFPVVVKPVSGTGSSGVKMCETVEEVNLHAGYLLRQKQNERGLPIPRRILVEEMALGPEYSVETFGRTIIGVTEKHLGALPNFIETGHDYPAQLTAGASREIRQTVSRAIDALGLIWGPAHFELRLTSRGARVIEANPRLAGGYIPELVRLATGVDLIDATLRAVLGAEPDLRPSSDGHASIRFILAPAAGKLVAVAGLELARQCRGIVEARLHPNLGEELKRHGDFRDRIGHVIATGETAEAARRSVDRAHRLIGVTVNPVAELAEEIGYGKYRTNHRDINRTGASHPIRTNG